MTDTEANATVARFLAEIAQLNAETARLQAETRRLNEEAPKISAETRNLSADRDRVYAETRKLEREARWFPLVVFSGAVAATVAIFTAAAGFLKFLAWLKP
jgi:hypothetical protein